MGAGTADDQGVPLAAETESDPALDEVLHDAGFEVTEAGRQRWRRRLSTPIPAEALEEGRRMRARVRGRAV